MKSVRLYERRGFNNPGEVCGLSDAEAEALVRANKAEAVGWTLAAPLPATVSPPESEPEPKAPAAKAPDSPPAHKQVKAPPKKKGA